MVSKTALINIGLAIVAVVLVFKAVTVWQGDSFLPEKLTTEKTTTPKNDGAKGIAPFSANKAAPKTAFGEITSKNLFSPERSIGKPTEAVETKEETVATEVLKVEGKQILLYGVILMDGLQMALISDPATKPGAAATSRWVKPGERVAQLEVAQINKESIVLAENGKKYRVELYDQTNKPRSEAVTAAPAAAAPTVVSTSQLPKAEPKPSPKQEASKKVEPKKETPAPDDGYEMVDSPFGPIKRKKK